MKAFLFKCMHHFNILYLKSKKCKVGNNVKVYGFIYVSNHGKITIGDNVVLNSGHRFNPIGGQVKTRIIAYKNSEIIIGNNVGISNSTIVASKKITIGENTLIGSSCNIVDTDFHSIKASDRLNRDCNIKSEEIIINSNTFIGAHVIILKGSIIGRNTVVGAGSVLACKVSKNEIWAGNPIKFIKKLND